MKPLPDAGLEGLFAKAKAAVASLFGYSSVASAGVPSDAQKIKDTFWQHHNELTTLESRQTELKKQLSNDYGPSGEFLTLRDR